MVTDNTIRWDLSSNRACGVDCWFGYAYVSDLHIVIFCFKRKNAFIIFIRKFKVNNRCENMDKDATIIKTRISEKDNI